MCLHAPLGRLCTFKQSDGGGEASALFGAPAANKRLEKLVAAVAKNLKSSEVAALLSLMILLESGGGGASWRRQAGCDPVVQHQGGRRASEQVLEAKEALR